MEIECSFSRVCQTCEKFVLPNRFIVFLAGLSHETITEAYPDEAPLFAGISAGQRFILNKPSFCEQLLHPTVVEGDPILKARIAVR